MKQMEVKTLRAEFKATQNGSQGIVTALVSVFGNIDLGGDRMLPGSFSKTIQDWQAKGDPLPAIWSHEWDDPEAHVGFVDPFDMKETAEGLEVKMQFDLDRPFAEQVFHLLKTRRVTQFSFGYYVNDFETTDDAATGKRVRNIKEVELFEVGPTLLGMNPDTQLIEAASLVRGFKAGRVLSGQNEEALKSARDLIDGVLSSVPATSEEPAVIKSAPATEEVTPTPASDLAEAPTEVVEETPESEVATRDIGSTITQEKIVDLLTRPKHTED
jgi:HK97 family phage prohead protease